VKEVNIWKEGGASEYHRQYMVNIINAGPAPVRSATVSIDSDHIKTIWNMKETGRAGAYALPAWLSDNHGIPANGGTHNFGFICTGKVASARVVE
jgi:hypothetical protein